MKTILLIVAFCALGLQPVYSQWTPINTGVSQVQTSISAVDDNIVWISGYLGRVCRTTNGGTTWSNSLVTPDSLPVVNIFGFDQNTALAIAEDNTPSISSVWKTTNGGGTWIQVFSQSNGQLKAVEIFPGGTGFMTGNPVGGRWSLWRTSNFGSNWDSTGMYLAGAAFTVENCLFASGANYWFGSTNGRLYHSSNSGSNWSFQTLGTSNITGIWLNGTTGLVTNSGGYRSTNSGANWSTITIPGSGSSLVVSGYGSNFWMVTKGSIFIYNTTDNGTTWSSYSSAHTKTDIALSRSGTQLWISTVSEFVLKYTATNGITQTSAEVPEVFSLSQNYPNPFNPVTNIEFSVPKSSFVKLAVYDITGRELETLVSDNLTPGMYKADWDASKYSSGAYFYSITSENYHETRKMILIK
jgi:photosystem II stability/assembly factor-like uncharacterized protein